MSDTKDDYSYLRTLAYAMESMSHRERVDALKQYGLRERLVERHMIALDNYHGHTFSDSTDYKIKFDKFIRNNEHRRTLLEAALKEQKDTK